MSIKRSKQQSYSRRSSSDGPGFSDAAAEQSWEERMNGQQDSAFVPYSLTASYEKENLILHPKFGKGVVVAVDGGHVDVLFEEGKKTLGHGKTSTAMPPRPRRVVEGRGEGEAGQAGGDGAGDHPPR